jgi:hypothetical protein
MKQLAFILLFSILIFSVVTINGQQQTTTTVNEVKIFPPDAKPFGLSYEDHAKNYWKWQLSLPIDKSPYKDNTGEKCASGQTNSNSLVFYLSGGGGGKHERECKVPAGKGVLIPVLHVELSDKEVPNASPEELSRLAKIDQDHVTSLVLEINGKKIIDEKYPDGIANAKNSLAQQYRTHTGEFDVVFPENAIFGASAGPSKAVADGFYIITEPLEKGVYDIVYKGSIFCDIADCLDITFAQDMRYKLIVE